MTTVHTSKKQSHSKTASTKVSAPTATTSTTPAFIVAAPPSLIALPGVPDGFVPIDIRYFLGFLPKAAQLAVMSGAVRELKEDFPDYATVFGATAPPLPSVVQAFDIANQWSAVHARIDEYTVYCASQEALAWKEVHDYMASLQPAFALATKAQATVATEHPSLTHLFNARKAIAQKAATTRKANEQLKAEGKLPTKGTTGQRRKRVAANALFAAAQGGGANAAQQQPPPAGGAAGAAGSPPLGTTNNGTGTGH